MSRSPSSRIAAAVEALPLKSGQRVLEIGCGPGVAAREIVRRVPNVYVLGIDRSASAIRAALASAEDMAHHGRLAFRCISAEDFALENDERPFDLAFALRVGALDGRHPAAGIKVLQRVAAALTKQGRLFIDGGSPLQELRLTKT